MVRHTPISHGPNTYQERKRKTHRENTNTNVCISCIWNAPLRIALPIIICIICLFPVLIVFQVSSAEAIFQPSKIKAQIKRANLRRQVPVENRIVIVQIEKEAVKQAEMSSLIHDMEDQLEEDLEQFKIQHKKWSQRYEKAGQKIKQNENNKVGLKDLSEEENGTPDKINEVNELKNRQKFQLYEKEEENKKKIDREKQEMAKHIRESLLKHRESLDEKNITASSRIRK